MTKLEANGDLKSFLQKQGAFYESTGAMAYARTMAIANQIVQGALFLSEQESVSSVVVVVFLGMTRNFIGGIHKESLSLKVKVFKSKRRTSLSFL